MIVLVALPTAVNLADDGLTWIWTRSLPGPLLHAIAWAGLLDAWLLLDLLAAVGVLGGAAVMAVAARRPAVAVTLLGLVAAVSLAAVPIGPEGCPSLWYGLAYAAALATLLSRPGVRGGAGEAPQPASVSTGRG
ncbi:hypothetical protein [Nonomuraea sp. NPDC049158]|uniref:hypothetical protein n=1 Tax=Nonomuraea sp. NPDC049158 TaxID=3155649 RepID=UPI0033DB7E3C